MLDFDPEQSNSKINDTKKTIKSLVQKNHLWLIATIIFIFIVISLAIFLKKPRDPGINIIYPPKSNQLTELSLNKYISNNLQTLENKTDDVNGSKENIKEELIEKEKKAETETANKIAAEKKKVETEKANKIAAEKKTAETETANKIAAEKKKVETEKANKIAAEKKTAETETANKIAAEKKKVETEKANKIAAEKKTAETETANKIAAEKKTAETETANKIAAEKKKVETEKANKIAAEDDPWWVINAYSSTDADEAKSAFNKLKGANRPLYSYETEIDGVTWTRVRVGFFSNQQEALAIGQQLAEKYKLPQPWVVKPGPDELKTYKHN